jgi:hypothetical protein
MFALAMRFRIVFVRKPNSSGGLSYIPAHSSPNKVIRSGHLIGAHTHSAHDDPALGAMENFQ